MSTVNEISSDVYRRLEEDPSSPTFWTNDEVYPSIVEAMNELCLITGEPEIKSNTPFTITANSRFFTIPNNGIVLLRMDGPNVVRKTTVYEMDVSRRGWIAETGDVVKRWFPFGIGQFGVYPLLTADTSVLLTYVRLPVAMASTYTGAETSPFREEFREALVDYADHVLRMKELGSDFTDSMPAYDRFLARASELTKYGQRTGKLRFSRPLGIPSPVTNIESR